MGVQSARATARSTGFTMLPKLSWNKGFHELNIYFLRLFQGTWLDTGPGSNTASETDRGQFEEMQCSGFDQNYDSRDKNTEGRWRRERQKHGKTRSCVYLEYFLIFGPEQMWFMSQTFEWSVFYDEITRQLISAWKKNRCASVSFLDILVDLFCLLIKPSSCTDRGALFSDCRLLRYKVV